MNLYRIAIVAASAFGYVLSAALVYSGPLDRGPMQQRFNPAAESMLRVPGVVGSYEQDALAMLQQAGLAVTTSRITEDDPRYEGKEGMVVSQNPSAGGVAMIGASVNITVYKTGLGNPQGGFDDDSQSGDDSPQGDPQQEDIQQGNDGIVDQEQWHEEAPSAGGWAPPENPIVPGSGIKPGEPIVTPPANPPETLTPESPNTAPGSNQMPVWDR